MLEIVWSDFQVCREVFPCAIGPLLPIISILCVTFYFVGVLRVVSYNVTAADSLPVNEAVKNSNFEPVLYTFPIKAYSKDSTNIVIDATPLFEKDVKSLGLPQFRRTPYRVTRLEANKSFIEGIKKLIALHPSTKSQSYNVDFISFGSSSLNIMINVYFKGLDWGQEQESKHILDSKSKRKCKVTENYLNGKFKAL